MDELKIEVEKKTVNKKKYHTTHSGHRATVKELRFIDAYLKLGSAPEAAREVGYSVANAYLLLEKDYIKEEIDYLLDKAMDEGIASAKEVLKYLTMAMRGEIKDQFGLDAPLAERTKAATELAKRIIDVKDNGKEEAKVHITLDWGRPDEEQ